MVKEPPNWYLRYAFANFKLQISDFSTKKNVLLITDAKAINNFSINKLCDNQLYALDKSIKTVPT